MTNFDHMRKRLLQRAGVIPKDKAPLEGVSYDELRKRECSDGFCELMDNRIVMGHLRYGPMMSHKPEGYDINKAMGEIRAYQETGNTERLVNAANWCRLEFNRGKHPKKHLHAEDRA